MNKFNQFLFSVFLVSALVLIYLSTFSFIINAKADYDCMKYGIPSAQVVMLKTYCGGILQGTEQYLPLTFFIEQLGGQYEEVY